MSIKLNHTIVPAKDKEAAAKFFAKIFGLNYEGSHGSFRARACQRGADAGL